MAQQRGAHPAGRAEAATLVREEMREIARHLEQVARFVEHHEGARGGQVLEADAPVEFGRIDADSRGTADLHRLGAFRTAILQHLAHRHTERVFIDAGARAVAGYRQHLGTGGLGRTNAAVPLAAPQRYQRRGAEGLDIVDRGRLLQITVGDRILV